MTVRTRVLRSAAIAVVVVALVVGVLWWFRPPTPPVPADSARLREAITTEALLGHLDELQRIADAHDGNRAAGTAGHEASLDYVEAQLTAAGYRTQRQRFSYERPDLTRASLVISGPGGEENLAPGVDQQALVNSGTGRITAPLTPVDLDLDEPGDTTSGCQASDFEDFPRGNIALVQRGTCRFGDKVDHAVAAGAGAVIVFNQGDDDRTGLFEGALEEDRTVPVLATGYDLGVRLAETPTVVTVAVDGTRSRVTTENLIADSPGDPDRTLVVGAHLDSVRAGAGINDNGSGVVAVLETALQLAGARALRDPTADQPGTRRVRFAFWSGEEDGLHGSTHYVDHLTDTERSATTAYLNLDMLGSPNPVPSVYGGSLPGGWPAGSDALEALLTGFLTGQGVSPGTAAFRASDHAPFLDAGVPVGGLYTGSNETTSDDEASRYGGIAGEPPDPCYHQACDRVAGIDPEMLGLMADATAHAVLTLARD